MSSSTTAPHLIERRLARLCSLLPDLGVDGLLISQPENRRYLSGFTGSAGALLLTADRALIATDFRYYEQVGRQCPLFELVRITKELKDLLPSMLQDTGVSRLGFEADNLTVAQFDSLKTAAPGIEWQPTRQVTAELRAIKDEAEIEALRRAIVLTDEALEAALAAARPGMTELELAWSIESYMRTHGANNVAFDLIVAGGPNSALPHAEPGDNPLLAGEPIVIDIGAEVDGYHGDMTRTVCFGQPNDPARFWEIYNTVLRAQVTAEAGIRPGMSTRDADALARDVIVEAGFGNDFGHGLGHGVGLQIHESPLLSRYTNATVREGMLITIEPGIYIPGWGGVRIEDVVLITENGAEVLTGAPKHPIL
jgi:Xaa-Pro aminopeptidase